MVISLTAFTIYKLITQTTINNTKSPLLGFSVLLCSTCCFVSVEDMSKAEVDGESDTRSDGTSDSKSEGTSNCVGLGVQFTSCEEGISDGGLDATPDVMYEGCSECEGGSVGM